MASKQGPHSRGQAVQVYTLRVGLEPEEYPEQSVREVGEILIQAHADNRVEDVNYALNLHNPGDPADLVRDNRYLDPEATLGSLGLAVGDELEFWGGVSWRAVVAEVEERVLGPGDHFPQVDASGYDFDLCQEAGEEALREEEGGDQDDDIDSHPPVFRVLVTGMVYDTLNREWKRIDASWREDKPLTLETFYGMVLIDSDDLVPQGRGVLVVPTQAPGASAAFDCREVDAWGPTRLDDLPVGRTDVLDERGQKLCDMIVLRYLLEATDGEGVEVDITFRVLNNAEYLKLKSIYGWQF